MEVSSMREPAFVSVANKVLATTLIAAALLGAFGCGDDDDGGGSDAGPTTRAGRGGSGGNGGAGTGGAAGAAPIEPLPDKTAGKACDGDKDCGSGMCLLILQGSFGGAMMEAPGGYCSAACMTNTDCGEGGTCSGAFAGIGGIGATTGRCLKSCSNASDCRDGYRCVNALGMAVAGDAGAQDPTGGLLGGSGCEPIPATDKLADGIVGSPCEEATDCGAGRCQTVGGTTQYPGGYCTGMCLENSDCGANGSCTLPLTGGAGTCYLSCGADSDCREGYRCRPNGDVMQCAPGAAPLPDNVVGNACDADADCGGAAMSCRTQLGNSTAPGGYCSLTCIDNTDCGSVGACVGGLGAAFASIVGATGTCYKVCADATGCRDGYTCGRPGGAGATTTQNVCAVTPPPPPVTEDAGVE
jgi:hypothetical protein